MKNWVYQNTLTKEMAAYYDDKKSDYVYIKCGHCSECIREKIQGYAQRIMMESINNYMFLCTLTYSNSMLPGVTIANGKTVHFADTYDVSQMLERMQKWRNRGDHTHKWIRYPHKVFAVSELGGKKARPHFHMIIFIPKRFANDEPEIRKIESELYWAIRENWARNEGTNRKPVYTPLFRYAEKWVNGQLTKNYDLHWVDPKTTQNGEADAAFYVLKYLLKQQNNDNNKDKEKDKTAIETDAVKDDEEGWEWRKMRWLKKQCSTEEFDLIWPRIRSKAFYSKWFGLNMQRHANGELLSDYDIEKYIRNCIEWSKGKYDFPVFINPANKKTTPLCNYYRKKYMTLDDVKAFWKEDNEGLTKYGDNIRYDTRLQNTLTKATKVTYKLNKLTELDYYGTND